MCGIAGSINRKIVEQDIYSTMLHRGPDEQSFYRNDNIELHHLRLSILDIEGGKQPMHLSDRYTIIFNGEIYNHNELRKKFNLKCSSNSDTETLLHLYHLLGKDLLIEIDGMFALAIYDNREKTLFIARDRSGKKPVYLYKKGNSLVFASELKCLNSLCDLSVDTDSILHFIQWGYNMRSTVPYNDVVELLPAHYIISSTHDINITQHEWWSIQNQYHKPCDDTFEVATSKVDDYLDLGVSRRIDTSDLEVGCFLSGGIDSGLVTAKAAAKSHHRLKTFTVKFDGAFDEAPLAKQVAEKYNTDHTEIEISFDHLENDIEQILSNYGEPFSDSSAIPSYYVSEAAKKHITVVLNGDGADELFGGYRRYVPFAKHDFFNARGITNSVGSTISKVMPSPKNKKSLYNYAFRLANMMALNGPELYNAATVDIYDRLILDKDLIFTNNSKSHIENIINDTQLSGLQKLLCLDFTTLLPGDLLVKMDIATMAHSLEGRSPLLMKELLDYVPTISDSYKIKGKNTKHILRTLSNKYLPSDLIHQPKRGFEIPLSDWVENQLSTVISDYLTSSNGLLNSILGKNTVENLLNNKLDINRVKRNKIIWALFSAEVWYQNRSSK